MNIVTETCARYGDDPWCSFLAVTKNPKGKSGISIQVAANTPLRWGQEKVHFRDTQTQHDSSALCSLLKETFLLGKKDERNRLVFSSCLPPGNKVIISLEDEGAIMVATKTDHGLYGVEVFFEENHEDFFFWDKVIEVVRLLNCCDPVRKAEVPSCCEVSRLFFDRSQVQAHLRI